MARRFGRSHLSSSESSEYGWYSGSSVDVALKLTQFRLRSTMEPRRVSRVSDFPSRKQEKLLCQRERGKAPWRSHLRDLFSVQTLLRSVKTDDFLDPHTAVCFEVGSSPLVVPHFDIDYDFGTFGGVRRCFQPLEGTGQSIVRPLGSTTASVRAARTLIMARHLRGRRSSVSIISVVGGRRCWGGGQCSQGLLDSKTFGVVLGVGNLNSGQSATKRQCTHRSLPQLTVRPLDVDELNVKLFLFVSSKWVMVMVR